MRVTPRADNTAQSILGIDGGGTRTVAVLANYEGRLLRRAEFGLGNLPLLGEAGVFALLRSIARVFARPGALAIGLAGVWSRTHRERARCAVNRVWPGVRCHITNDLEVALAAARPTPTPSVLITSGTGSCCYAKDATGHEFKIGGWGHLLGDKGSGHEIGLRALKAVVHHFDHDGIWPPLGRRLLRALQLNEPGDLVGWVQSASKAEIAALATEVFAAWDHQDKIAADIFDGAVHSLAKDGVACGRRVAKPGKPVRFILAGSVLLKQPRFAGRLAREIRRAWPGARVESLHRENVWGAVELARPLLGRRATTNPPPTAIALAATPYDGPLVRSTRLSPTEQRNPRSVTLHRMPLEAAIHLMLSEEARVPRVLRLQARTLARAIRLVVASFRRGGRLFYVGAGTSGRLGVLDASECPVTFRVTTDRVQGIIAGGPKALSQPVEGAEDDVEAGARAVGFRSVGPRDVVVGIAASGTTPFVWGALREARRRRARTLLVAFNPYLKIPRALRPEVCITPNLGPEVLTGSTRLKAGTATKLILNLLTTLAMVRLGKVESNLMVDVVPTNAKLRDRAVRIVQALTGADHQTAAAALRATGRVIRKAALRLRPR